MKIANVFIGKKYKMVTIFKVSTDYDVQNESEHSMTKLFEYDSVSGRHNNVCFGTTAKFVSKSNAKFVNTVTVGDRAIKRMYEKLKDEERIEITS